MSEAANTTTLQENRFWLLRLVMPNRWGRWLTGLLIFVVLLSLFAIFGGLFEQAGAERTATGVALFFCIILAYIVPIHDLIVTRAVAALNQLNASFPALSEEIGRRRQRLVRKPGGWVPLTLVLGVLAGTAHNALLVADGELAASLLNPRALLPILVTGLVWVIMTTAIASLVECAVLFKQLAARVPVDVLNVRALTPFGSVAVSSTLAMIGAQAAFPVMMLESDVHPITFIPGLIATGVPMVFLFVLPIWPAHRRILAAKRQALDRVDAEIRAGADTPDGTTDYARLAPLLLYRREIAGLSEWPFDTTVMGRLLLYLIIPPLTWIGAALIEILVDTAI